MPSARGNLAWTPATDHPALLAKPVAAAIDTVPGALVAPIDAELADTDAFCRAYDVALDASANCVVVAGRRTATTRYPAATSRYPRTSALSIIRQVAGRRSLAAG